MTLLCYSVVDMVPQENCGQGFLFHLHETSAAELSGVPGRPKPRRTGRPGSTLARAGSSHPRRIR